jgi:hypothetical protein
MIMTKATAARNLPTMTSLKVTGSVIRISYEPADISSENRRMVTAGMMKEKMMGSRPKKLRRLAWLYRKKVEKKNQPVMSRNMAMTI